MKISKELVSAVMQDQVETVFIDDNTLHYSCSCCATFDLNLYEFIHKNCKEWLRNRGILIRTSCDGTVDTYNFNLEGEDKGMFCDSRTFDTEEEAVIHACEWEFK